MKIYSLILFILMFTSCSKTFIDNKELAYVKTEGYGLIVGYDSLSLGYLKEERIYGNPKECQAILIVDSNSTDLSNILSLVENICIIRR